MGENFVRGKSVGLFLIKILEIIKLAGSSLGFLWLPPRPEMAVAELSRAGQAVWPLVRALVDGAGGQGEGRGNILPKLFQFSTPLGTA